MQMCESGQAFVGVSVPESNQLPPASFKRNTSKLFLGHTCPINVVSSCGLPNRDGCSVCGTGPQEPPAVQPRGLCCWTLLQFVTHPQINVLVSTGEFTGAFSQGKEGVEALAEV